MPLNTAGRAYEACRHTAVGEIIRPATGGSRAAAHLPGRSTSHDPPEPVKTSRNSWVRCVGYLLARNDTQRSLAFLH
jgi:hypothetical protein